MNVKKNIGSQCGDVELGKRLRKLRVEVLKADQKSFARLLGVSQAIISQWESGKYLPSAMALMAIGRLAGDDKEWWFRHAGENYGEIEKRSDEYKKLFAVDQDDNRVIPIHGNAGAGPNRFVPEHAEARISLPRSWFRDSQSIVGLRVSGNSMSPLIQDGFLVLVDIFDNKDFSQLEGKIVAARNEHGVVIKWLRKIGASYYLISQNLDPQFAPIEVKKNGYAIVGRVIKWIGTVN